MVEHLVAIQKVASSSLVSCSIFGGLMKNEFVMFVGPMFGGKTTKLLSAIDTNTEKEKFWLSNLRLMKDIPARKSLRIGATSSMLLGLTLGLE